MICPICHARTTTPAALGDGTLVCQLCAVDSQNYGQLHGVDDSESLDDAAPVPPPGLKRKRGVDYGCGDSTCDRCYEPVSATTPQAD